MTIDQKTEQELALRQPYLSRARRVVVKVGSAVLSDADGLDCDVIGNLAADIVWLRKQGMEVLLVTSGAVAAGRRLLDIGREQTGSLHFKQAAAAVGQGCLMGTYEKIFKPHGVTVAQILLTHDDLADRNRYLNIRNTLFTLLSLNILPIINENDTVSVEELRFGDNDTLAGMVSNLTEADALLCLTDVSGLYSADPSKDPTARKIFSISKVTRSVEAMAGNVSSTLGTGGMQSKIRAAKMVAAKGGWSFIGPGKKPGILQELFQRQAVGTFFLPDKVKISTRKQWIASILRPKGELLLDSGASHAVVSQGKSLLPSGVLDVRGRFGVGAPVYCVNEAHKRLAVGLVNYSSSDIVKIRGLRTSQIISSLGFKDSDEIIHRDNLVILEHGKEEKENGL